MFRRFVRDRSSNTFAVVLHLTLGRRATATFLLEGSLRMTAHEEKAVALATKLRQLLHGDWTLPCIQHYCCNGCCRSRAEATEKIIAVLAAAFFDPLSVHIPAESRWWTFGPTLSVQSGGFLCHQILPRTIQG